MTRKNTAEQQRINDAARRAAHWKRWGPYVSERQWGTVREDYSPSGDAWRATPFDEAHLRAWRWGEDGLAAICDNHQRLCLGLALWNGKDPILKERLFGLAGPEGNHGEDVKELYWYLDSSPTHSYLKFLYKYPLVEFPYQQLRAENAARNRLQGEYELEDTGIFDRGEYADILIEYAKNDVDDVLMRITVSNRSSEVATVHVVPQLWFRNTWAWKGDAPPVLELDGDQICVSHPTLGHRYLQWRGGAQVLMTDNESNGEKLGWWQPTEPQKYYKDAFSDAIIQGNLNALRQDGKGTKAGLHYQMTLQPGETQTLQLRLTKVALARPFDKTFEQIFIDRIADTDAFYHHLQPHGLSPQAAQVQRQALAGLLWTKQYYTYDVSTWLQGDSAQPPPPDQRKQGRNSGWQHLFNDDVISMPDKWEYPWFAAWDLAFHCVAFALIDPDFAKRQLRLLLREWYMHPNGQIPAYEWNFSDVNPPVHAWAAWRVYKIEQKHAGHGDLRFLEKIFHKLLINFTWWVNRKDAEGNNVFEGGFLGLDNIGVFDRSSALPTGGKIEQSDATSWMAMYCLNMLAISMELARHNNAYEDVASKFFEHFMYIAHAMNATHLWDRKEGFFYDVLALPNGRREPMHVRSMVGLIPLFAVETLSEIELEQLPRFRSRLQWFVANRRDLHGTVEKIGEVKGGRRLLSIVDETQLRQILQVMLDEAEFLAPHGIRSLSRAHAGTPYTLDVHGQRFSVHYEPAESQSAMFGGNSNWRGPIWFPVNVLLIESLQRYSYYFGDAFLVEFPSRSGKMMNLQQVAAELSHRLAGLFLPDAHGNRPCNGGSDLMNKDPNFAEHILFHEYFDGDTGKGLGASHQSGWTSLVAKLLLQSPV